MTWWIVLTGSGFWKCSCAHLVMSVTCQWVMQCHLKTTGIQKYLMNLLTMFDDVIHCGWWKLRSLCILTLWNTSHTMLRMLSQAEEPLLIFTSERLSLSKTSLLQLIMLEKISFNLNYLLDVFFYQVKPFVVPVPTFLRPVASIKFKMS